MNFYFGFLLFQLEVAVAGSLLWAALSFGFGVANMAVEPSDQVVAPEKKVGGQTVFRRRILYIRKNMYMIDTIHVQEIYLLQPGYSSRMTVRKLMLNQPAFWFDVFVLFVNCCGCPLFFGKLHQGFATELSAPILATCTLLSGVVKFSNFRILWSYIYW